MVENEYKVGKVRYEGPVARFCLKYFSLNITFTWM